MKPLFWIDMEMTGLDEHVDSVLEVAIVITDLNFEVKEEYDRVVYQPQSVLDNMNDWCKKNHGSSGLTAAVKAGTPLAQVEKEIVELIDRHYAKNSKIVLCGNSVGNDRRFVDKYLPLVSPRLHYRVIDVSSFKEIFRQKYNVNITKKEAHRALGDIHESIQELKTYLSYVQVKA